MLLENFTSSSKGILVTHSRAKQRSDRRFTKFLIPRTVEDPKYADICEAYLNEIRFTLGKSVGRVWYTGRQDIFANIPMGTNMISKVPHDIAKCLGLDNVPGYAFHSFRRTAATVVADQGATSLQMQQHFGWKNDKMSMEYMSTSKTALKDVAGKLATKETNKEPQQSEGMLATKETNKEPQQSDIGKEEVSEAKVGGKENVPEAEVMMEQVGVQGFMTGAHTFAFPEASKVFFISGGKFSGNFN